MKFNYNNFRQELMNEDFSNIKTYYPFYFDKCTKTARRMFCQGHPIPSKEEIIKTKMIFDLHGLNYFEVILWVYLTYYKMYVKDRMQPTAPFHKLMKKEIKNLIDKVESGII